MRYIRNSRVFVLLSIITVLVLGLAVWYCDKIQMHLWFNSHHTLVQDFIWSNYTYVGGWVPYVIVGLLLFYKAGWASFLLADILISGGIGQGLKYWADTDRPLTYFANNAPDIPLPLVEGVRMSEWYSFPSGHTITFFALFMTLAVIINEKNKREVLSVVCFLFALAGAYSRIYLSQHFTEDIVGGILIGVISTMGLMYFVPKLDQTVFWNWNIKKLKKG